MCGLTSEHTSATANAQLCSREACSIWDDGETEEEKDVEEETGEEATVEEATVEEATTEREVESFSS